MAVVRLAAGGLLLFACLLQSNCSVIRIPKLNSLKEYPKKIHDMNSAKHDELDPSYLLASIHSPTDEDFSIHQLSRNLLSVTKDLISYTPRSKSPDQRIGTYEKLSMLRNIQSQDLTSLLSQHSVFVPAARNVTCDYNSQYYRTMDGSCNNLEHVCWGKSEEPYRRWLIPSYENGIDEPRMYSKKGGLLPNPRQIYQWVSSQFNQNSETTYPHLTNLAVVWGQMVAHDILLTPTVTVKVWNGKEFKNEKPHCCDPNQSSHPDCMPIIMNSEDVYYSQGHCIDIARSVAYMYSPFSCSSLTLGRTREQMNQITSFLDASLVYGSSEVEMRNLREFGGRGAKLLVDNTTGWSVPTRRNSTCKSALNVCNKNCFLAGEKRANENPILGAMHTLWLREHNRLVDLFKYKNWPEETLFHVVRKILGALLQHITYKEYLPQILGQTLTDALKLSVPTNNYKYNKYINPTLYNAFVTAAFRYGHSMVSTRNKRASKSLESSPILSQDFFSMDDYCNSRSDPIANLLYGQLFQKSQKVDCLFSKQMTNHLFAKEPNGKGLDIFSINVQRGRDHGIPPYNDWRETCGMSRAKDYSDLKRYIPDYVVDRLEKIYGPGNVEDIDLFVGGISEYPVNDGILGPTFTCIVANQFGNLKFGDRFWYENTDHPGALSPAQIADIQKTTIASLICRNTRLQEMPQLALLMESPHNFRMPCDAIVKQTDLDLNLW